MIFKAEQVGGQAHSSQGDNLVMMSECSEGVGDISSYKDRKAERYEEVYRQERENFIFNAFINFRDGWSTCIPSTNQLMAAPSKPYRS